MHLIREVHINNLSVKKYNRLLGRERVGSLLEIAKRLRQRLAGRIIWNINSTAVGGGVAELLPSLLGYARGAGIPTRWIVIGGRSDFFTLTKRLHHALHGQVGDGAPLDAHAQQVYEKVMRDNATELLSLVRSDDIVVLHDPQTIGLAPLLSNHGAFVIWRCHIGREEPNAESEIAWKFLQSYLKHARHYIFSCAEYVPEFLNQNHVTIISPSIDPFSPKNQYLDSNTVHSILVHTGLIAGPLSTSPTYEYMKSDGSVDRVDRHADIIRCGQPPDSEVPLVLQVSRWDPLKDHVGVMRGFSEWLNRGNECAAELILAGPVVHGIADDPEGPSVFADVFKAWCQLPHWQRNRVHLAMLPMADIDENGAIVNALQRHAKIIVQKSLQEGFGLTVTEAMWKSKPVIGSNVGGIKVQIETDNSGLLLDNPGDLYEFADKLDLFLSDQAYAHKLGEAAKRRVRDHFLDVSSLENYARLLTKLNF